MFKWIGWTLRLAATALLLSFLSIWTTGYIVNSYMETLLKQLDLPLETQPFALSGMWGKLWGASPAEEAQSTASNEPKPSTETPAGESGNVTEPEEPAPSSAVSPEPSSPPGEEASGSPEPDPQDSGGESVPVFGGSGSILDMTDEQRQTLNSVMTKLNAEQLGLLSSHLENGLTELELQQLDDMLKPLLDESEYDQMMELLKLRAGKQAEEPETAA